MKLGDQLMNRKLIHQGYFTRKASFADTLSEILSQPDATIA